jgi:hypothetical protein
MLPMIWILQGDYGHGWEDLTASEVRAEIVTEYVEYVRAEAGTYRIMRRRQREGE